MHSFTVSNIFFLLFTLFYNTSLAQTAGLLESKIVFATNANAAKVLGHEDEYTKGWSKFDIESRMQKANATRQEQISNTLSQIREWDNEEKNKLLMQIKKIDELIATNHYHLHFLPQKILLIKSTLNDEGGAEGYTRSNAIVLKDNVTQMDTVGIRNILIHELFHVISRFDKNLRKDLYALFGFTLMNEVPYPDALKDYKISNPDAPFKDSYIKLETPAGPADCMMILYSEKPYSGGSFFDYLQIGFLQLKGNERKEADIKDGNPIVHTFESVASSFFRQVGQNTQYIIDPEEIVADNFVQAITNKPNVASPALVEAIKLRLKK